MDAFSLAEQINIVFTDSTDAISFVQDKFAANHIEIINLKAEKTENASLDVELFVKMPQKYDLAELMDLFKDNPHIKSVEF